MRKPNEWWIKFGKHGNWPDLKKVFKTSNENMFPSDCYYTLYSTEPVENGTHVIEGEAYDQVLRERDVLRSQIPEIREALAEFQAISQETLKASVNVLKKERDDLMLEAQALADALDDALRWNDFTRWSLAESVLVKFRAKHPKK